VNGLNSANAPSLDLPARFMALSVIALAAVGLTAPWALPLMRGPFSDFQLLAFVHLTTLGFVGAMIIGASYQLVPVALQVPLSSARFGRISFWFYLVGLGFFLIGLTTEWLPALGIGGSLLEVAFLLYILVVGTTWFRAPERDVVAWHILFGLAGAGIGMTLGFSLALNKSNGMLGSRLLEVLAAHISLMLGGWVLTTFTGVAYRLIGMFTLSERHFRPELAWAELVLTAGGSWALAIRFALDLPSAVGQLGAASLLAGLGCFMAQIVRLYQRRMRRGFDVHIPYAVLAAALAIAASVLLLIGLIRHETPNASIWFAIVWLALFGAAGTAIQGFFYKIATFLVWLKRYAPVAGKERVPRLEELYSRHLAMAGWSLWASATIGGAALLIGDWTGLRLIGLLLLLGIACFLINVVSIARHWFSAERPFLARIFAGHRLA
jgi:hypothetical protein